MINVPPLFLEQMQQLLEDEYPTWLQSYAAPARQGLRVNTLKIEAPSLRNRLPYRLEPLPWSPEGFLLETTPELVAPPPGKHPYHAAGLYYLQEPSAMAVARALDPQPGERILDLCAAPGGKSTHIVSLTGDRALLVANESHSQRVWELAENLERWGARNAIITNETPTRLAQRLERFFDRVLVDAPCSGEGMFRKSEAARRDWSPRLVRSCALRQSAILEDALRLTRPGGRLVYSTCTFNPIENEQVIASFLARHPRCELLEIQSYPGFSPGRAEWVEPPLENLKKTIRLWPHHSPGEGHFIAAIRCCEGEEQPPVRRRAPRPSIGRPEQAGRIFSEFCNEFLTDDPLRDLESVVRRVGARLYAIPRAALQLSGLKIVHPGWWLGTIKSARGGESRFEPSHALALGLRSEAAKQQFNAAVSSSEILSYLRGEALPWDWGEGWTLVGVDGFPLGWGKASQGRLKNAYPHGLRWH